MPCVELFSRHFDNFGSLLAWMAPSSHLGPGRGFGEVTSGPGAADTGRCALPGHPAFGSRREAKGRGCGFSWGWRCLQAPVRFLVGQELRRRAGSLMRACAAVSVPCGEAALGVHEGEKGQKRSICEFAFKNQTRNQPVSHHGRTWEYRGDLKDEGKQSKQENVCGSVFGLEG